MITALSLRPRLSQDPRRSHLCSAVTIFRGDGLPTIVRVSTARDWNSPITGDIPPGTIRGGWTGMPTFGWENFSKTYRIEERISIRILLDCSESMTWMRSKQIRIRSSTCSGFCLSGAAASGLGSYRSVCNAHDTNRLLVSGGRDGFWPVMKFLSALPCGGETDISYSTEAVSCPVPAKGNGAGDFGFFDEEGCARAMEMLRASGHDLCSCSSIARKSDGPPYSAS